MFKGQRSKVKVMTRPINLYWRRHAFQRCGVEVQLLANIFVSKSSFECLLFVLIFLHEPEDTSFQLLIIAFCALCYFIFL